MLISILETGRDWVALFFEVASVVISLAFITIYSLRYRMNRRKYSEDHDRYAAERQRIIEAEEKKKDQNQLEEKE